MLPTMTDAVAVLVYQGFAEFEVAVALALLAGQYRIENVGLKNQLVRGEGGLRVYPDKAIHDVNPVDYAALIIPGAVDLTPLILGPDHLSELVARFARHNCLLAASGNAPYLLGRAGLLKNTPYTATLTRQQREQLFVLPAETFTYQNVVQSGNLITAQSHAFVEFGLSVAQSLNAVQDAERARAFYSGQGNRGMETDQQKTN